VALNDYTQTSMDSTRTNLNVIGHAISSSLNQLHDRWKVWIVIQKDYISN